MESVNLGRCALFLKIIKRHKLHEEVGCDTTLCALLCPTAAGKCRQALGRIILDSNVKALAVCAVKDCWRHKRHRHLLGKSGHMLLRIFKAKTSCKLVTKTIVGLLCLISLFIFHIILCHIRQILNKIILAYRILTKADRGDFHVRAKLTEAVFGEVVTNRIKLHLVFVTLHRGAGANHVKALTGTSQGNVEDTELLLVKLSFDIKVNNIPNRVLGKSKTRGGTETEGDAKVLVKCHAVLFLLIEEGTA